MSRRVFAVRCSTETPDPLAEIAKEFGCVFIGKGGEHQPSVGMLLDKIASGELSVVRTSSITA